MRIDQDPALSSFGIPQPGTENSPPTLRQRMIDEACTVIAVDGSTPLQPGRDMLAGIHRNLGHPPDGPTRTGRALAWSGWLCALAAVIWAVGGRSRPHSAPQTNSRPVAPAESVDRERTLDGDSASAKHARMAQEIEALRQQIKILGERDGERMTATPGVSWPVIMNLSRPGSGSSAIGPMDLMLTSLEDPEDPEPSDDPAAADPAAPAPGGDAAAPPEPVAIPIYDPARDRGQLILMNLPMPEAHLAYHLWVQVDGTTEPILIGTLPAEVNPGTTTMDFRLGSAGAVPDRYWITLDARQSPGRPAAENTILLGPAD